MLGVFYETPLVQETVILTFLFFVIKIFFYAGILASIVDILSGDEIVLSFELFRKNAKKYWQDYLLIILLALGSFVLLSFFFVSIRSMSPSLYASCFNMPLLFLLALRIARKKYSHITPLKTSSINFKEFVTIFALYATDLCLLFLYYGVDAIDGSWVNLLAFTREWLEYIQYSYLAMLVLGQNPEIKKHFNEKIQFFLVNPFGAGIFRSMGYAWFVGSYPPAFTILKTFISSKYKIREFNQRMWQDRYFKKNALVAVTSYTSNCFEAYRIAKKFKDKGATVIMGGPHVTYLADEALEFCDSVVIGEAQGVWPELLKDYENGKLKKTYFGGALNDENNDKVFQSLLNSSAEIIKDFLETSRGCKFKCHFCTVPALSDGRIKNTSIIALVELINKIKHKYRRITFIDNNIYNDPGYAKELFRALKPLNIKWRTACTIDIAKNEETLKLARESGCEGLLIGYEISGDSLEKLGGKFSMAEQYAKYTKKIRDLGIRVRANFIFGFDSDRFKSIFGLWKYCLSLNAYSAGLSFLTPLPGSQFYNDLIKNDQITNLNWRKYTMTQLVFKHKYLTPLSVAVFFPVATVLYFLTASRVGSLLLLLLLQGGVIIYFLRI